MANKGSIQDLFIPPVDAKEEYIDLFFVCLIQLIFKISLGFCTQEITRDNSESDWVFMGGDQKDLALDPGLASLVGLDSIVYI